MGYIPPPNDQPFHFQNVWLLHYNFNEVVSHAWPFTGNNIMEVVD